MSQLNSRHMAGKVLILHDDHDKLRSTVGI